MRSGGRRRRHPAQCRSSRPTPASKSTAASSSATTSRVAGDMPDLLYAVGECAEHRGRVYGLVAPLWEQTARLADRLSGRNPDAVYTGSHVSTKLKVMGVDLAVMGDKDPVGGRRRGRQLQRAVARHLQEADRAQRSSRWRHRPRRWRHCAIAATDVCVGDAADRKPRRRCCFSSSTVAVAKAAGCRGCHSGHGADLRLQRRVEGADRRSGAERREEHAGRVRRHARIDRMWFLPAGGGGHRRAGVQRHRKGGRAGRLRSRRHADSW